MSTKRETILSRVRKVVGEAKSRNVWGSIGDLFKNLARDFASKSAKFENGNAIVDEWLNIFTGTEFFEIRESTYTHNSHWRSRMIRRGNGEILYHADFFKSCPHVMASLCEAELIRHLSLPREACVCMVTYKPGQWERILVMAEARRLLDESRQTIQSLRKRRGEPLSRFEVELAQDFGVRVK